MTLKYPNCEVCRALREAFDPADLPDSKINAYHEGRITLDDLPKRIREAVLEVLIELEGE